MRRPIEDGLSLLAGAGIGMALMYLLDPEAGEQRRRRLAQGAACAAAGARDAAGAAWEKISDATSNVSEKFADTLADGRQRASAGVSDTIDSARSYAEDIGADATEAASGMLSAGKNLFASVRDRIGHRAREKAQDIRRGTKIALTGQREHHYVGQTACALGSLALGAGIVWMFDPRLGHSRRAWLRDKSMHWLRETGDFFRVSGRYLSDHLQGTVAETRGYVRDLRGGRDSISDEKLCARIRSQLGRVTRSLGDIQIKANEGHVIIRGACPPGEDANAIYQTVLQIRGVRSVDNQIGSAAVASAPTGI